MEMPAIEFGAIERHPADAVRFFKIMMRLEYALKAIGFAEMDRNNRLAVSWTRFVNECLDGFFQEMRDSGKANTLITQPPSHQEIDANRVLSFRAAGAVRDTSALIGALQRVRNNLFHGGKAGDPDHNRNDILIAEAIEVITEMLLRHNTLREAFEGRS